MLDRLKEAVATHCQDDDLHFIKVCHEVLMEMYPGLQLRWVHIYGQRWAYIYGEPNEISSHPPCKIRLSQNYGLCIDNNEMLSSSELESFTAIIKEHFHDKIMV